MKTVLLLCSVSSLFLCSAGEAARNICKDDSWFDASFLELGCLLFNRTASLNWEEANVYCQKTEQAQLVEISNKDQLDFVQMELGLLGGDYWWTSATDQGREGAYAWRGTSSGTRMNQQMGTVTTVSVSPGDFHTSGQTVSAASRHKSSASKIFNYKAVRAEHRHWTLDTVSRVFCIRHFHLILISLSC